MIAEIFNTTLLIRLVASFFCSAAFAVVFKADKRHLFAAGLSGIVTWFVYHLFVVVSDSVFIAAFLSTLAGAVFAEIYARVGRTPVTVILFASMIPIVPGGDLYYTMQHAIAGAGNEAIDYFIRTMSIALGIAGGIVVTALVFKIAFDKLAEHKKRKSKTNP